MTQVLAIVLTAGLDAVLVDLMAQLKALRLHGMAGAGAELVEQGGNSALESSRWPVDHLVQAEGP